MTYRLRSLVIVIAIFAAALNAQNLSDSKKSAAWQLGSQLSVAGVLLVDSNDKALVDRQFARASAAASKFGLKLPALPVRTGQKVEDSAAVLQYLLGATGNPIGAILRKNYGPEHAAVFEIALKANILIILYGPGEKEADTIANVIRKRRVDAKLPNGMTDPLLALIDRGATYNEVKNALFDLNDLAPNFIAVVEYSDNGERFYAEKDYASSAAEFTKAIGIDPAGPEYYFSRGRAYLAMGKSLEAVADYTKVIQLKSTSVSAAKNLPVVYHNRGLCYGILAKNSLAIADLTMAIKLKPDYASAYKVRGLVYKKMRNARLAAADLEKAESLQPGITK